MEKTLMDNDRVQFNSKNDAMGFFLTRVMMPKFYRPLIDYELEHGIMNDRAEDDRVTIAYMNYMFDEWVRFAHVVWEGEE